MTRRLRPGRAVTGVYGRVGTLPHVIIHRAEVDRSRFNPDLALPYNLRASDFAGAMQDIYDFFYDVNRYLLDNNLQRLEDMLRPANLSGTLSDMLTDALAKHSRSLTPNLYHNGHPDLIVRDRYPGNRVKAGEDGVEVKSTRKVGGAVDTHGARNQTLATFVYTIDNDRAKPAQERDPLRIREIYCGTVTEADFRSNSRGRLGTRTATLDKEGIARFRQSWVYMDVPTKVAARTTHAQPWRSATS